MHKVLLVCPKKLPAFEEFPAFFHPQGINGRHILDKNIIFQSKDYACWNIHLKMYWQIYFQAHISQKKTLFFAYAFPVRQLLKDTILKKQTYSQSFTLFNDENISN